MSGLSINQFMIEAALKKFEEQVYLGFPSLEQQEVNNE